RLEDRRVEARVGSVQDRVGLALAEQGHERVLVCRVGPRRAETAVAFTLDERLGASGVEVRERHALEEVPPLGDGRNRGAHAPGSDHEYLHRRRMSVTPSRKGSRTSSTRSSPRTWSLKRVIARAFSPSPSRPKSVLSAAITPPAASFGRIAS